MYIYICILVDCVYIYIYIDMCVCMCVGALFELRAEVEFAPSSAQHSHLRLRAEAVLDAVRRCDRGPGIAGLR